MMFRWESCLSTQAMRALVLALFFAAPLAAAEDVRILHDSLTCWPQDQFMVVRAGFRPPTEISTAKFYYRAQQHVNFYFVVLAANALGDARAVVPMPSPGTTHIEYFIELVTPDFTAIRNEPTVVPVGEAQACREQDPSLMLYSGENPNLVVGATRAGVPQITPGFQARGMVDFISISGGVTTGGAGKLPIILGGIGAGGAVFALTRSGGDEPPNNSNPPIGGGSTTITVSTTTSVASGGGGPTTTSVAGGGGGPTTTTVTGSASTSVPIGSTTTGGPTTSPTTGPTTAPANADMSLLMTGTYVPPAPPSNTPFVIFTKTATNIGTAQANNVLIFTTSLPSGATLSGLTNCAAGNPIICNCGNVPAGNPCVGQIRYIPSGSGSYSVSATVTASNDSNGGNDNASASAIVPLRQSPLVLELRTSLIAPPTDGRVRGQLIVNDSNFVEVDNGGPRTIHTNGRAGRNRFRAR